MRQILKQIVLWQFIIILFTGCATNAVDNNTTGNKIKVVVTTGMVADAVKNIVKDKMEVTALMGPGVDPHLYKATQGDLTKLTDADIIFYNGLHLEGKMQGVFEKMGRTKAVYAITDGITKTLLRPLEGGENTKYAYDPHIWFNVALWSKTLKGIADKLSEVDKTNATSYQNNYKTYEKELLNLHNKVLEDVKVIPEAQRVLITSHDAFGYLGDAYDFEVKALQGISTVNEFGLQDVKLLVDYITDNKVKAIFVESSVPRKPLEAVIAGCKNRGSEVTIGGELFSDAMGAANSPEGTYIGMVKHNFSTIINALK